MESCASNELDRVHDKMLWENIGVPPVTTVITLLKHCKQM